tara:strand:+ start:55 stop:615 length:561 start_codon:yes stop_codon:yes gene_type:complete
MKARNLIPLLLVLFGCLQAEPLPRNVDTLVQQGDMYLDRETMLPYSGPIFSLMEDDSSTVQMSTTLKDGLRHGPLEAYYENGQLMARGSYSNGEPDGPWERYHENGQLLGRSSYSNGEWDGPYEQYYENGQLSSRGSYSNGERDGPYEDYDENGQLFTKGTISNGERCGEWFEGGEAFTFDPCPSN